MDYSALSRIKLFLLDMEGTFYAGGKLLPGSKRFLEAIGEQGADYLFMTHDSSLNRYEYAAKLGAMGLETPHTKVLTSGYATCAYLKRRQPDAKVYLVGTPALQDEFIRERIDVVNTMPDYIVLGFDTTLTYRKLSSLCQYVRSGVEFIATHPDLNHASKEGYLPDIGGVLAFVKATTNRDPDIIIGKPYRYMLDIVLENTGLLPEEIAVVGDRLYTDVAFGRSCGIPSILVLSGETSIDDLSRCPVKPDYTFADLGELAERLSRVYARHRR